MHLLNECATLVRSPQRAVAAEVGGVSVRAMVVDDGFVWVKLAHFGGQSDHFQ